MVGKPEYFLINNLLAKTSYIRGYVHPVHLTTIACTMHKENKCMVLNAHDGLNCFLLFFDSSRSALMPSYMINLTEMDEKIMNVVDYKFLFGYYEPTLLILYEPLRTWPG